MKKIFLLLISLVLFFSTASFLSAENINEGTLNNHFGIHINDEKDLNDAALLVNSSGGDWGYVTFVITEAERNHDRWQKVFDEMRKLHLIPIVRIATKANGSNWEIPKNEEINNWISFLNSLNWVIKNRYIVIGNEPNHAKEWGGKIEPEIYAKYLYDFSVKLHQASSDFFVLPAGLDASARNTKDTMDETLYIKKMLFAQPNLFDGLNGWTSHSYPNPDFAGDSRDTGRGSIQTFNWEINYLRSLGVYKELPIFITETGWSNKKIDPEKISLMYEYAFNNVWNTKEIMAVTPFTLNYPEEPFAEFSWKKKDGSFYPYFDAYKKIAKVEGKPEQKESGQIIGAFAQPLIIKESDFVGAVLAKNTGQSIWTVDNLHIVSDNGDIVFKNNFFFDINPFRTGLIIFRANPGSASGIFIKSIYLESGKDKRVTNSFPVEALIVKADKVKIQSFFDKLFGFFKSKQFLNVQK